MKNLIVSFLVFLLPACGWAEDVYHVHQLTESELLDIYTGLLRDACHHADQVWHDWAIDPRGGFWGTGRSDNMNEGIRSVGAMTLTCGSLLKYAGALDAAERAEYKRKSIAAIRYATASHVTGPQKCTDGRPWGDSLAIGHVDRRPRFRRLVDLG